MLPPGGGNRRYPHEYGFNFAGVRAGYRFAQWEIEGQVQVKFIGGQDFNQAPCVTCWALIVRGPGTATALFQPTSAPPPPPPAGFTLAGQWFREGDLRLPTSITQTPNSLVFANETGQQSTGVFRDASTVVALQWQGGLLGRISIDGLRIEWANRTSWQRPQVAP